MIGKNISKIAAFKGKLKPSNTSREPTNCLLSSTTRSEPWSPRRTDQDLTTQLRYFESYIFHVFLSKGCKIMRKLYKTRIKQPNQICFACSIQTGTLNYGEEDGTFCIPSYASASAITIRHSGIWHLQMAIGSTVGFLIL